MTTGRRPTKKSPLRRPFVVTVAIGIPTLVAFGCGTSKPSAGPGGSSGGPAVPPPTSDGSCTQEGATQTCHVDLGRTAGLQSCFYGTQSCLGGRWTACGGAGKIVNSTADNLATALQQAGLASQLQVLSGAAANLGDASTSSSLCTQTCIGGANDKGVCTVAADCPAIQCSKVCIGGTNAGAPCSNNGNCNSNNCSAGKKCIGGSNAGAVCANNGDCPGSGSAGTCSSNDVCNPNCKGWDLTGTPEGGGGTEAGIGVSGFGQTPAGQLNKLLDDACHPGGSGTCVQGVNTLYQCQMDTYCNQATGCCLQFPVGSTMDGTVSGPGTEDLFPDVTIGPGCCDNCRTTRDYPICNRGNAPIPAGTRIATVVETPNTTQNPCPTGAYETFACPASGLPGTNGQCCTTVDATHGADPINGLLPGQCMLMNMSTDCKGGEPSAAGDKWLYTNSNAAVVEASLTNVPATVPATTPACANNWSDHPNSNNPPSCRTSSTAATSFIQNFTATCPIGYVPQWTNLTWASAEFSSGGSNTEILFEAATAPLQTDGGIGALSQYYEIGEASLGNNAAALDQATCDFTGPVTALGCTNSDAAGAQDTGAAGRPCCPKNFTNQFMRPSTVTTALFPGADPGPGLILARQAFLSMRITLRDTSDGKYSPQLNNWSIDFTCVPNE
jgi:hypothetical protein